METRAEVSADPAVPVAVTETVPPEPARSGGHDKGRAAAIATLTFLAGPPLGATPFYLFLIGALFTSEAQPPSSAETITAVLQVGLFVTLYSYVLGGLQALVAGIAMGLVTWQRGLVSYRETILIALVVSAGATGLILLVDPSIRAGDPAGSFSLAGILAVLSLLSAVLCRFIAGRIGIFPRA